MLDGDHHKSGDCESLEFEATISHARLILLRDKSNDRRCMGYELQRMIGSEGERTKVRGSDCVRRKAAWSIQVGQLIRPDGSKRRRQLCRCVLRCAEDVQVVKGISSGRQKR
ncbi:uncharacterized protein UHOD_04117 [Ustilago sp. UG-2017b]|nr:uncharacterized protein UHOD_04117 [Ustilago sp. UG-2017b]